MGGSTINPVLLARLLGGGPLTVAAVAGESRQSPDVIVREIETLRDAGCEIETHPREGFRLLCAGLGCWADFIESRHQEKIGRRLVVYRQTASTQDAARKLVQSGDGPLDGCVVVADHQTGGRGRLGRRWFAPPGSSMLLTAVVRATGMTVDRLMLASCCGVAKTIESFTGSLSQVRWPNDVLIEGGKIAGILVETAGEYALIGVGINVSLREHDLPPSDGTQPVRATSLALRGVNVDRLRVLDVLLKQLQAALRENSDTELHAAWLERSCLLQQRITVENNSKKITGRVMDVDPRHGLLLTDDLGGHHTLPAATASLIHN